MNKRNPHSGIGIRPLEGVPVALISMSRVALWGMNLTNDEMRSDETDMGGKIHSRYNCLAGAGVVFLYM
jgi:hypothetical protein